MKTLKEYTVVRATSIAALVYEVNYLAQKGYVPQGGVCTTTDISGHTHALYQAMALYGYEDPAISAIKLKLTKDLK